jgi:signal transduction histidine kinase
VLVMSASRHPDPPNPAAELPLREGEGAVRAELIAALDHDLRTSLTTVLGALQTMARPELAPTDPEAAQLVSSALAQAQRMRRLLDELPAAASPGQGRGLDSADLTRLIRQAADPDNEAAVVIEVPAELPTLALSAAGLQRVMAGILGRVGRRPGTRVVVMHDDGSCRITITAGGGEPPAVPSLTARLVTAMGGRVEQTKEAGSPAVSLVFPGARRSGF